MDKLKGLHANVRLSVSNPDSDSNSVFGPGIAALCRGVRDRGSLYAAAKAMGMAYSKAWRIIKETEEALAMQLLDRDGARGSTLTPEGDRLLSIYDKLDEKLAAQCQQLYEKALNS